MSLSGTVCKISCTSRYNIYDNEIDSYYVLRVAYLTATLVTIIEKVCDVCPLADCSLIDGLLLLNISSKIEN